MTMQGTLLAYQARHFNNRLQVRSMNPPLASAQDHSVPSPTREDHHVTDARTNPDMTTDQDMAFANQFDEIDGICRQRHARKKGSHAPSPSSPSSSSPSSSSSSSSSPPATLEQGNGEGSQVAAVAVAATAENGQGDDRDELKRLLVQAFNLLIRLNERYSTVGECMDADDQAFDLRLQVSRVMNEIAERISHRRDDRDDVERNHLWAYDVLIEAVDRAPRGESMGVDDQASDFPLRMSRILDEIAEKITQGVTALVKEGYQEEEEDDDEDEDDDEEEENQKDDCQEEDGQEEDEQEEDDTLCDNFRAKIREAEFESAKLRQELHARVKDGYELLGQLERLEEKFRSRRQRRGSHGR